MKVKALRNRWMTWAKVHGFDGKQGTVCHGGIYLGVNGWVLEELAPEDITCEACADKMFPPVPSITDMEKLDGWVNGRPII